MIGQRTAPPGPWAREDWTTAVMKSTLPAAVKLTGLALADLADREGHAAPGERRLAAAVMLSRSAVWKHLTRLRTAGVIEQTERAAPHRAASYRLTMPPAEPR